MVMDDGTLEERVIIAQLVEIIGHTKTNRFR